MFGELAKLIARVLNTQKHVVGQACSFRRHLGQTCVNFENFHRPLTNPGIQKLYEKHASGRENERVYTLSPFICLLC
jgi:hypothetical protein